MPTALQPLLWGYVKSNICIATYNKPAWKLLSAVVVSVDPLGSLGTSQQNKTCCWDNFS